MEGRKLKSKNFVGAYPGALIASLLDVDCFVYSFLKHLIQVAM